MKILVKITLVTTLCFLAATAAWAGGPEETGRQWAERALQMEGRAAEAAPQAGFLYYIDLMSNASDPISGGWQSFLVVTNWDLSVRIRVITSFIPTGGTPSDIVNKEFFINPNDVVYLSPQELGFNDYGKSNWYGLVFNDTNNFFTVGVLLYHSEFGLSWVPSVFGGTL